MSGRQDLLLGNILLYDYLSSKRNKIFLNRSITRALSVHRYILEHGTTQGIPGPNHEFRSEWGPPSWDALDDMVEHEKSDGSFVLEVHGLKALTTKKPTTHNRPARKVRQLFSVQTTIQISVLAEQSNSPCKSLPPQEAVIKGVDSDHGRRVYTETDKVVVKPKDLLISSDSHNVTFSTSYKMMLSVNFGSQRDAECLYKHLDGETAAPQAETCLSATFGNILECPAGTVILPLKDHKKRLNFGLEVSMYWTNSQAESILTTHNRQLKSFTRSMSYPTPPREVDKPRYRLTFIYAKEVIVRSELVCPHEKCYRRKPADMDDLRMHLEHFHDYFKYEAIKEGLDSEGAERWRFQCEVSDHKTDQRASARINKPSEIHILAPPQPFNQSLFLQEGNDDYQKTARFDKLATNAINGEVPFSTLVAHRQKPPEQVQDIPVKEKKKYPVPRAPSGVTFFRSCSRRPLQEGEYISESEDEIDGHWIELWKAAEDTKNTHLSASARGFLKIFDKFMQEEDVHSNIHVGDALVRFSRHKGALLWHNDLFGEFQTKIDELVKDDVISEKVHAGCLDIVQSQKPNTGVGNDLSRRLSDLGVKSAATSSSPVRGRVRRMARGVASGKGKGKAEATDTGILTPLSANSDGNAETTEALLTNVVVAQTGPQSDYADLPFDQCVCGGDALTRPGISPVITCNGIDCIRRYFHLNCIKQHLEPLGGALDLNRRDWTCGDCKYVSAAAS